MTEPVIYHGTPMTPRAALQQMAGRAFCVSFYRPDDVEVVEAISPAVMFRQWRVFVLAISSAKRTGLGRGSKLATILQMARTAIANRPLGSDSRQPWSTITNQRWTAKRLAFWSMGSATLAHGQSNRSFVKALRQIRSRLLGLDRSGQGFNSWLRGMVSTHGRSCQHLGKPMAQHSYDARRNGCARVSISKCGQHQLSAERTSV